MKQLTKDDHERAARLFTAIKRNEKLTFSERNILNIYNKRIKKGKK